MTRHIDPLIDRDPHCRIDGEIYADRFHDFASTRVIELTPAVDAIPARSYTVRYNWLRTVGCVLLMVASVAALVVTAPGGDSRAAPIETVRYGDEEIAVAAVQQYLVGHGYSLAVDGVYGPQTLRAVTHFQRANGLLPDGIVGPLTQRAMGFVGDAPPVVPSSAVAPVAGLRCPQWAGLLEANGLPVSFFDPVMYRESRCDPSAHNGRGLDHSYGLLQINTRGNLWGELQRRCGLSMKQQLWDPATNVACAAALFRAYGYRPWS